MKRYNHGPARTGAESSGPYCTVDCANLACRVNFRNCKKGERITLERVYGTGRCRGYKKPIQ